MPYGDRTGPFGQGSRTGRGMGYCSPGIGQGYGQGYGRGFGRGRGWRWFAGYGSQMLPAYPYAEPLNQKQEKNIIKEDIQVLEEEIKLLESRLQELKRTKNK